MAASYPAGFDTMSDPSTNLSGPPLHSTMHTQINDVIEAIEAELGLNPSGVAATVAAVTAVTAWTGVTFQNSWVNFGGTTQTVQFRKIGDMVYIRGIMKSGTINTAAFTLPVGFRPPAIQRFPISAALGTGAGLPNVTVDSAGVCIPADMASNTNVAVELSFSTST